MTTLNTLRSVLEALKHPFNPETREPAITDLTALIADMEGQKPVAWLRNDEFKAMTNDEKEAWAQSTHSDVSDPYTIPLYTHPQPKPEPADMRNHMSEPVCEVEPVQEPVGHVYTIAGVQHVTMTEPLEDGPLYAAAPQAKPLTDEQIDDLTGAAFDDHAWRGTTILNREVARAVERAHKIGVTE